MLNKRSFVKKSENSEESSLIAVYYIRIFRFFQSCKKSCEHAGTTREEGLPYERSVRKFSGQSFKKVKQINRSYLNSLLIARLTSCGGNIVI